MKWKLLVSLSLLVFGNSLVKAQYCVPQYAVGCLSGDQINTFILPGENSTQINTSNTGCSFGTDYGDYTSLTVDMNPGGSYTATINSATNNDFVQVYIDFDNDQSFAVSESVGGTNTVGVDPATSTFAIDIPSGSPGGTFRMRVVMSSNFNYPNIDPCPTSLNYGGGEVHDYTAIISGGGTTCDMPANLAATAISFEGATLNWTAVTGATGYEWVLDQVSTDPLTSGMPTALTTYTASGLSSNTMYYFHLRTACTGGTFSDWIDVPFMTLACPAPTGVTETAVAATTATVSWSPITGAQGYQYAVTTAMTPPSTGTYTTNASVPVTGLTAMTTYHTWVRTVCGVGDTSAWNAMHMWTTLPVSVVNVGNTDFLLEAYPNPAKSMLTIAAIGKGRVAATIQLTDITGKVVNSYEMKAEQMNLDMSNISAGVYFIRYADKSHRQTIKITKE